MKRARWAFFLASFLAIFFLVGCMLPWEEGKPAITQAPQPSNSVYSQGAVQSNETIIVEGKGEESGLENKSKTQILQEDEFAGITPRNISQNIGDGEFRVRYQPAALLQVYVISGGNADSIFVKKGEFTMLVGAGNATAVKNLLESLGIRKINAIVATKNSQDAIGGMREILRTYAADEIWSNGVAPSGELAAAFEEAKKRGIFIKLPQAGDSMEVNGLRVDVLNPQKQRLYGSPESDAIVLKLSFNNFCMLLLNPATQEIEPALLSSGISPRCDVLTYFNHGEGRPQPSLLLEKAQPQHVIISVGENSFGLPSATTLTRLAMKGAEVYRTDLNGTVVISTDGLASYDIGYAS